MLKKTVLADAKSNGKSEQKAWIVTETENGCFPDERLASRFGSLMESISHGVGDSIPAACRDWANTKAAYRFLSNHRVTDGVIMKGHFVATHDRCALSSGTLLVLHDTCEFTYHRNKKSELGVIGKTSSGKNKAGRPICHTVRGVLMHSSLVITPEGLPLGLAAIKFWSRKKFTGCNARKRRVNPTRVAIQEKESIRWIENIQRSSALIGRPVDCVHIGDREADIYELFAQAARLETNFLVRTCVDRLIEDGSRTVAAAIDESTVRGIHRISVRGQDGEMRDAVMEIKYERLLLRPPVGKRQHQPDLTLTVIHATERDAPEGEVPIFWKLLTNLPVQSLAAAIEKLSWYALRWKIETFHKVLKSGCKAEDSQLRTSSRLSNLLAVFCIISWRILWMTMLQRSATSQPASAVFTEAEICLLDHFVKDKGTGEHCARDLSSYIVKLARLGGYLNRASDGPPGNKVIWRGMAKLNDIQMGFEFITNTCG